MSVSHGRPPAGLWFRLLWKPHPIPRHMHTQQGVHTLFHTYIHKPTMESRGCECTYTHTEAAETCIHAKQPLEKKNAHAHTHTHTRHWLMSFSCLLRNTTSATAETSARAENNIAYLAHYKVNTLTLLPSLSWWQPHFAPTTSLSTHTHTHSPCHHTHMPIIHFVFSIPIPPSIRPGHPASLRTPWMLHSRVPQRHPYDRILQPDSPNTYYHIIKAKLITRFTHQFSSIALKKIFFESDFLASSYFWLVASRL